MAMVRRKILSHCCVPRNLRQRNRAHLIEPEERARMWAQL